MESSQLQSAESSGTIRAAEREGLLAASFSDKEEGGPLSAQLLQGTDVHKNDQQQRDSRLRVRRRAVRRGYPRKEDHHKEDTVGQGT